MLAHELSLRSKSLRVPILTSSSLRETRSHQHLHHILAGMAPFFFFATALKGERKKINFIPFSIPSLNKSVKTTFKMFAPFRARGNELFAPYTFFQLTNSPFPQVLSRLCEPFAPSRETHSHQHFRPILARLALFFFKIGTIRLFIFALLHTFLL